LEGLWRFFHSLTLWASLKTARVKKGLTTQSDKIKKESGAAPTLKNEVNENLIFKDDAKN
jgi:hypothetical protein